MARIHIKRNLRQMMMMFGGLVFVGLLLMLMVRLTCRLSIDQQHCW